MMYHSVYNGCCDDGVSEVIAEIFKVNVRCEKCRTFAVTAVDDLEEKRGMFAVLLLQPVKS